MNAIHASGFTDADKPTKATRAVRHRRGKEGAAVVEAVGASGRERHRVLDVVAIAVTAAVMGGVSATY